jgi:uncharacterized membrane protein YeiH
MDEQIQPILQALQEFFLSTAPLSPEVDNTLNLLVFFVQWSAIILSTLTGLYAARKHGMDFYGSLVIAFVVALGGGTIRDVLLGRYPIFWLAEPVNAVTVLVIALLSILVGGEAKRSQTVARVAQPVQRITDDQSMVYLIIDSLALGLWAYLGSIYALQMGTPPVVAPIMGVITASFGGVLRDVFFARVPQSFMPSQLYAAAAAAGAIVYVLLWELGVNSTLSFLACFLLTFMIRMASVKLNIQSR